MLKLIHRLEVDARWQLRFHGVFTLLWFGTIVALPFIRILWESIPALIIEEVSLWANFATHFGAMSSALAAINTQPEIIEKLDETATELVESGHLR